MARPPTAADLAHAAGTPAAFGAADLAAADPVLGPDGLPLAHPGRRAVVFQLITPDGRALAAKCYPTDPDLDDRYARVAAAVRRGRLPFAVPARYVPAGLHVGDHTCPVAVLDWVEGVPLDRAVRDRADSPAAIDALFRAWLRLSAALREADAAHGELAPANVLVAADTSLRLIDYDSFHLPGLPPAPDVGHPDFRHPAGADPADRDRFPLLVVATALRAVAVLGRGVLDRYEGALLFTAADFRDPGKSPLLRELRKAPDRALRTLTGVLTRACGRPADQTPWADELPGLDAAPAAPRPRRSLVTAAAAGAVMLAAAVGVAALAGAFDRPAAPVVAENPPPKADPPAPKAEPRPPQPRPAPKAAPPVPELPPGVVGFRRVWATPLADERPPLTVHLTGDGRTVLAQWPDKVEATDAATGNAVTTLRGEGLPTGPMRVWSFAPDRVVVYGTPLQTPTAWNPRTGTRHADPVPGLLAPPGPKGTGPAWCEFSPDGKLVVAANSAPKVNTSLGSAPYRMTDVETGQVMVAKDWFGGGSVRFTADGEWALVADATGRVSWVWLRGWNTQVEWVFPGEADGDRILGLSADGAVAVMRLRPPGQPAGFYVMDARTGRALRPLGADVRPGRTALTDDGRRLVAVSGAEVRLTDARTGAVLVRTALPGEPLAVAFAADGRAVAVHDPARRELALYRLNADVPAVPADTPVPPVVAAPRRAVPSERGHTRPVRPEARPGIPDVPLVEARWTTPAPAALRAFARPQLPHFSPDGNTLAVSGGADGTVLTFDARTGKAGPVLDARTGPGGLDWLALLPGRVAAGGFDDAGAAWDAAGRPAERLRFPALPPLPEGVRNHAGLAHAVSPSGRFTLAARREIGETPGPLRVLDTTTGKEIVAAPWRAGVTWNVAFTADETKLFVLDGLGKGTWYRLPGGEVDAAWDAGPGYPNHLARLAAVSADGKLMAYDGPIGAHPGGVALVDGQTGRVVRQVSGPFHPGPYQPGLAIALSPDGRVAAVPVRDPVHLLWFTELIDVETWRPIGRIAYPEDNALDYAQAAFSPDGTEVALFFRSARELAVYPVPEGRASPVVPSFAQRWEAPVDPTPAPVPVVFDPVSRRVVVGWPGADGVTILNADTGDAVAARPTGLKWGPTSSLHVLPGGRLGFHSGTDAVVTVWDLAAGKAAEPLTLPPAPEGDGPARAWLSPDARFVAQTRGAATRVSDRASGKLLATVGWLAIGAAFTADGGRVLLVGADGTHRWFHLPSGDPGPGWTIGQLPPLAQVRGPSVSGDGSKIGAVLRRGLLPLAAPTIYDGKTGGVTRSLGAEFASGYPALVSADGRLSAALRPPDKNGIARVAVADAQTGRLLRHAAFPSRKRPPVFLFTPDGSGLVVHEADEDKVRWFELPKPGPAPPPVAVKLPPVAPLQPPDDGIAPRWSVEVPLGTFASTVGYDAPAGRVVLVNTFSRQTAVADGRTGAVTKSAFAPPGADGQSPVPLAAGHATTLPAEARVVSVLDPKGGVSVLKLPDLPPGALGVSARLSPDGRFLAAGRITAGSPDMPLPLRIAERATGKILVSTEWQPGSVHFTADGSRVLVAEATGRCRWFKLPTGEAAGGFELPPGRPGRWPVVTDLSADGSRIGYFGPAVGRDGSSVAVLDGATGQVVRGLDRGTILNSHVALSADGRLAAVMLSPGPGGSTFRVEVVDVATGMGGARAAVETANRSVPLFRLTPDGRALFVHDRSRQRLYRFDLAGP